MIVHRNRWIWGRTWILVAEEGRGVVQISKEDDEEEAIIHNLSVIPGERGKGLGRKLVEMAEKIIKEEIGDVDIILYVETKNQDLIRWYEKLGYHVFDHDSEYTDMIK